MNMRNPDRTHERSIWADRPAPGTVQAGRKVGKTARKSGRVRPPESSPAVKAVRCSSPLAGGGYAAVPRIPKIGDEC